MLRSLKKRERLIHHNAINRSRQTGKGKRHVGTLPNQELNFIAQLAQLVNGCILDLIERNQQTASL